MVTCRILNGECKEHRLQRWRSIFLVAKDSLCLVMSKISQRLLLSILNDSIKRSQLFWRLSAGESLSQIHMVYIDFISYMSSQQTSCLSGKPQIARKSMGARQLVRHRERMIEVCNGKVDHNHLDLAWGERSCLKLWFYIDVFSPFISRLPCNSHATMKVLSRQNMGYRL